MFLFFHIPRKKKKIFNQFVENLEHFQVLTWNYCKSANIDMVLLCRLTFKKIANHMKIHSRRDIIFIRKI